MTGQRVYGAPLIVHSDRCSFRHALCNAFGRTLFVAGIFKFVYDTCSFGSPLLFRELFAYIRYSGEGGGLGSPARG